MTQQKITSQWVKFSSVKLKWFEPQLLIFSAQLIRLPRCLAFWPALFGAVSTSGIVDCTACQSCSRWRCTSRGIRTRTHFPSPRTWACCRTSRRQTVQSEHLESPDSCPRSRATTRRWSFGWLGRFSGFLAHSASLSCWRSLLQQVSWQ